MDTHQLYMTFIICMLAAPTLILELDCHLNSLCIVGVGEIPAFLSMH